MSSDLLQLQSIPSVVTEPIKLGSPLYVNKLYSLFCVFPGCYYLAFNNTSTMGHAFCRIQEHYESPKFSGTVFTKQEYINWWKETHPTFSYPNCFCGYNFPGSVLLPFLAGQFNPLSKLEKELLKCFAFIPEKDFYVIGATSADAETITHEVAHALFYLDPAYKASVLSLLADYTHLQPYCFHQLQLGGYRPEVYLDELNAFLSTSGAHHFPELNGGVQALPPAPDVTPLHYLDFCILQNLLQDLLNTRLKLLNVS
jgi:hypothetical protein